MLRVAPKGARPGRVTLELLQFCTEIRKLRRAVGVPRRYGGVALAQLHGMKRLALAWLLAPSAGCLDHHVYNASGALIPELFRDPSSGQCPIGATSCR
jgi:hypothetical protein